MVCASFALTVRRGLTATAKPVWVTFEAVIVVRLVPTVLSVTLNTCVPATSALLAGRTAIVLLERMRIVSLVMTWFQLASTLLTVTGKDEVGDFGNWRADLASGGSRDGRSARDQQLQLDISAGVDRGGTASVGTDPGVGHIEAVTV